jgi:hypothetical protein
MILTPGAPCYYRASGAGRPSVRRRGRDRMKTYTTNGYNFHTDGRVLACCRRRPGFKVLLGLAIILPIGLALFLAVTAVRRNKLDVPASIVFCSLIEFSLVGLLWHGASIVIDLERDTVSRGHPGWTICRASRIAFVQVDLEWFSLRSNRVDAVLDDGRVVLVARFANEGQDDPSRSSATLGRTIAVFLNVPYKNGPGEATGLLKGTSLEDAAADWY